MLPGSSYVFCGFFLALHPVGTELEEQDMEHKAIILTNLITKSYCISSIPVLLTECLIELVNLF